MSVVSNQPPSRKFKLYMDSFFKFPKDIRNDIIYCQRALRDHIRVHQLVLDVFEQQPVKTPAHRDRIINEIESEIFEINAEQHFLFLRLRRVIDEFYKMLKKNDIPVETHATNNFIALEVVPYINDPTVKVVPVSVEMRFTEEMLIQKYFEVQDERQTSEDQPAKGGNTQGRPPPSKQKRMSMHDNGCEVIDLCDNDDVEEILPSTQKKIKREHYEETVNRKAQESLLKPFDQRVAMRTSTEGERQELNKTETSESVKLSRMNLRQALKRAHTSVVSAKPSPSVSIEADIIKTKENNLNKKSPPLGKANAEKLTAMSSVNQAFKKQKQDLKNAATKSSLGATTIVGNLNEPTSPEVMNSSSDDSNIEREPTSSHPYWSGEVKETRVSAEEYGQEMFLRYFDLYTPEVLMQLQQRRSKRKRRTIHNNERSDFHYGRIEYGKSKDQKKEVKTFLLSPQAKAKRPKRPSPEKIEESPSTSRSNSSSPNEKRNCNECLKGHGNLDQCEECKSYYHQTCHREDDDASMDSKLCPACKLKTVKLLKKEKVQNKNLHETAKDLQMKMATQKDRRNKLQNDCKMYKMKMRNLFNIVKTLKNDKSRQDDSSE